MHEIPATEHHHTTLLYLLLKFGFEDIKIKSHTSIADMSTHHITAFQAPTSH